MYFQFEKNQISAKWKLDEFQEIVTDFESELEKAITDKLHIAADYPNIVAQLAGKTIVTLRTVILLSSAGYPDEAQVLARRLYEIFINLSFFELKKQSSDFSEIIANYYKNEEVLRNKELQYEAEIYGNDNVKEHYINLNRKIKGEKEKRQYWWAEKNNFSDLEKEVQDSYKEGAEKQGILTMHLLYDLSSLLIHINAFSMIRRLGNTNGYYVIDTGPQTEEHNIPLGFGCLCLDGIIEIVSKNFQISYKKYTKKLHDLGSFYLKQR